MISNIMGRISCVSWKIFKPQISHAIDDMKMTGRLFIRYASKDKPILMIQAIIKASDIMFVCPFFSD